MNIFRHIFVVIIIGTLLTPRIGVSECHDCPCPEHTYNIGSKSFTWPEGPSRDVWIASNCMDQKKLLIFRKCMNGAWTPNNVVFQITCQYENVEHPSNDCPKNFQPIQIQGSSPKTICIREKGLQYDFINDWGVCIQDSIFTMELNNKEQTQLIERLSEKLTDYNGLLVLGARWRYPSKLITYIFDHEKEDVELQDVRCGRFGLTLKFNVTVPVNCTFICTDLCLYVNVTVEPFSQLIDSCSEYVIARPKNSFLHEIGCPEGYYRTEYDYVESGNHDACFKIQIFQQPVRVEDVQDTNIIQSYCNGTLMTMNWGDDLFIFRQLSERMGLSEGNQCLFGLTSNRFVTYSDWNSSSTSQTPFFFNWDQSMNYSHIISHDTVSYLAVKANGQWTWAIDSISCIVCIVRSPLPIAKLHLEYNVFERQLVLTVTNQNFLFKESSSDPGFICHFNYGEYGDIYNSNLSISRITYSTYLIEDAGVGQYWCSGHNVINRLYIWNGERIFAYGLWYAFEVVRKCDADCSFSLEDLNRFTTLFTRNNGFVQISNSAVLKHETAKSEREYTFTAYLSLTLVSNIMKTLATNLMNLTDYQLETYLIYEELHNSIVFEESQEMKIESIKSTEYCLHHAALSIEAIIWRVALIGETISASPLCPSQGNGSGITRNCFGDYVNGSFWDKPIEEPHCHTYVSESLLELLGNFSLKSQTSAVLESLEALLLENIHILLPLDVFLTSRILQKVSKVTFDDLQNIFSIYNILMQIDENFLKMSASMNSTNILLEALDYILMVYIQSSVIGSSEYRNYGNSSIHSSFIKTYILDPFVSGSSGIALYRPRNSTYYDDFTIYSSRYIYPNETIDDLMTDGEGTTAKDLVVGSYLPTDVLLIYNNITVVVTLFSDKLFKTTEEVTLENDLVKTYGKIISLKILGLDDGISLPCKIPVFFEVNRTDNTLVCGHWSSASISEWSSIGCNNKRIFVTTFQRLAVCECSRFTHFGYLMNSSIYETIKEHNQELHIFTVAATSFSFFGTLVVIVTAVRSKKWRQEFSSKILIHFSVAISLETFVMISIHFSEQILSAVTSNIFACVALGSILHYCVLATSSWLLIFAYFQFKCFIAVLNFEVSHLWLKSIIFGWVVPLLPVIIVLAVDYSLSVPTTTAELKFCHPTGYSLYLGVVAPIALICLANFIILISVSVSLRRRSNSSIANATQFKITLTQILASVILTINLSLAGIFAFLSKIYPNTFFLYIFYVTALLLGPSLLFNFIVCNINFILERYSLFVGGRSVNNT